MRLEIAIELATVALFDDQNAFLAIKRGGKPLGLHRGEKARREEARLHSVLRGKTNCFPRRSGERAPRDHGEIARTLGRRPMVAEVESLELLVALVELGTVIRLATRGSAALRMSEPVGRILAAARAGNRDRKSTRLNSSHLGI